MGPEPVRRQQNNTAAPDMLLCRIAVPDKPFQSPPVSGRNGDEYSCSHETGLAQNKPVGNPNPDSFVSAYPLVQGSGIADSFIFACGCQDHLIPYGLIR